ncbi:hypothetical protein B0H13DRAFT_2350233 [Mycena leptocephala]|nr:hypothetical protein B0H13DRAFT_2350233 [Mycena leptocephala]
MISSSPNLIRLQAQLREECQNLSSGSLRLSSPLQTTSVPVSLLVMMIHETEAGSTRYAQSQDGSILAQLIPSRTQRALCDDIASITTALRRVPLTALALIMLHPVRSPPQLRIDVLLPFCAKLLGFSILASKLKRSHMCTAYENRRTRPTRISHPALAPMDRGATIASAVGNALLSLAHTPQQPASAPPLRNLGTGIGFEMPVGDGWRSRPLTLVTCPGCSDGVRVTSGIEGRNATSLCSGVHHPQQQASSSSPPRTKTASTTYCDGSQYPRANLHFRDRHQRAAVPVVQPFVPWVPTESQIHNIPHHRTLEPLSSITIISVIHALRITCTATRSNVFDSHETSCALDCTTISTSTFGGPVRQEPHHHDPNLQRCEENVCATEGAQQRGGIRGVCAPLTSRGGYVEGCVLRFKQTVPSLNAFLIFVTGIVLTSHCVPPRTCMSFQRAEHAWCALVLEACSNTFAYRIPQGGARHTADLDIIELEGWHEDFDPCPPSRGEDDNKRGRSHVARRSPIRYPLLRWRSGAATGCIWPRRMQSPILYIMHLLVLTFESYQAQMDLSPRPAADVHHIEGSSCAFAPHMRNTALSPVRCQSPPCLRCAVSCSTRPIVPSTLSFLVGLPLVSAPTPTPNPTSAPPICTPTHHPHALPHDMHSHCSYSVNLGTTLSGIRCIVNFSPCARSALSINPSARVHIPTSPPHCAPRGTILAVKKLLQVWNVPAAEVRNKLEQRIEWKGYERVARVKVGSGCAWRGCAMVGHRAGAGVGVLMSTED